MEDPADDTGKEQRDPFQKYSNVNGNGLTARLSLGNWQNDVLTIQLISIWMELEHEGLHELLRSKKVTNRPKVMLHGFAVKILCSCNAT